MTAIAEPLVDLDALERDCETKIGELCGAIGRLSLDALSDPEVRHELVDVERELAEAQQEIQRIHLARAEQERRDMEARQKALGARQAAAYKAARQLQPKRERAAEAVDAAAEVFISAISEYVTICHSQQAALVQAGQPQVANIARARGFAIEATFARALTEARWAKQLGGVNPFERLPLIPAMHRKALAESDARPVEPLKGSK